MKPEDALIAPDSVLSQVAAALPEEVRGNVIIIGSLAAAHHFASTRSIRTKDVDCLLSPHAVAVGAAQTMAERLFASGWTMRKDTEWGTPGNAADAEERLPMIRLRAPAAQATSSSWFLEILSAPPAFEPDLPAKQLQRVVTNQGHFAVGSFGHLGLVEWEPTLIAAGLRIARPEMMALANLLHHPTIAPTLIRDTNDKRSNKDLGRVIALAYLAYAHTPDDLEQWAANMWTVLRLKYGEHAIAHARKAGDGLRQLLASESDFRQALQIANRGLLAGEDVDEAAFRATSRRFLQDVVDPLQALATHAASLRED